MRDEHIIEMLDNTPLGNLSAAQLEVVRLHSQNCVTCERAYQASQSVERAHQGASAGGY